MIGQNSVYEINYHYVPLLYKVKKINRSTRNEEKSKLN
jgi:hypothetical protein